MKKYSSFRTGGIAKYFFLPKESDSLSMMVQLAREYGIPVFILGGGTNILVSDEGIPGLVIYTGKMDHVQWNAEYVVAGAGTIIWELSKKANSRKLTGLEFACGLPGTLGGAVYMNARCYGQSIGDIIAEVYTVDADGNAKIYPRAELEYEYKKSIFQKNREVITGAKLKLGYAPEKQKEMKEKMKSYVADRNSKNHFKYPSAGSTFLNDPAIGMPTGKLIDSLGLKGMKNGGAMVAPYHGNILINYKNATSREIFDLIQLVKKEVKDRSGFVLREEVELIGNWPIGDIPSKD